MNELALKQIRDVAAQRATSGRADAIRTVDNVIHAYCERPHEVCLCHDNPLRGPAVEAVHREKQERVRRERREAA